MAKRESGTVSTRGIGVPKFNQEMLAATIAALAGITLVWTFSQPEFPVPVLIAAGAVFTVSIVMVIRLMMDPDSVRALQSDAMLQLASSMIDAMGDGLTEEASQEVCELLLPNTSAIAVALTNCESVLGYAGYQEAHNPAGIAIRTSATHECIRRGKTLVLLTPEEIGLPAPIEQNRIKAAIVEPLFVGGRVEGTLKFYYRDPRKITETQRSIAHGFAQLLIPAARSGGRGREAGCRNAGVEAQMVGGAGLLADTVGAVRKGDGRDALARQSAGGKDSLAREQGAFLL